MASKSPILLTTLERERLLGVPSESCPEGTARHPCHLAGQFRPICAVGPSTSPRRISIEFQALATRPLEANGLGLTPADWYRTPLAMEEGLAQGQKAGRYPLLGGSPSLCCSQPQSNAA